MDNSEVFLDTFLQSLLHLPLEDQKEALDKKIQELFCRQLTVPHKGTSPSCVEVSNKTVLHEATEQINADVIQKALESLIIKRKELDQPTREELEHDFHEAMHKSTYREGVSALLAFFRKSSLFPDKNVIQEIVRSEPSFNINSTLKQILSPERSISWDESVDGSETLLVRAVRHKDQAMVRLLFELGANLSVPDDEEMRPIWFARKFHNQAMIQLLEALEKSRSKPEVVSQGDSPYASSSGTASLHDATEQISGKGIETSTDTLKVERQELKQQPTREELEHDFHEAMNKSTYNEALSALFAFFRKSSLFADKNVIQEIVRSEPSFNINGTVEQILSPKERIPIGHSAMSSQKLLILAVHNNEKDMIELLVRLGADLNGIDGSGWTPLTLALRNKDKDMIELLVRLGADLNGIDGNTWTPLTLAVKTKEKDMIELLVRLGADLNGIDGSGWTPLTWAVRNKDKDMAQFLTQGIHVDQKANVDALGTRYSPLCLARLLDDQSMSTFLETELHANQELANQLFAINTTAHMTGIYGTIPVFDLEGREHQIKLEGGLREFALRHLYQTSSSFLSSNAIPEDQLSRDARDRIRKEFEIASQIVNEPERMSTSSLLEKIRQGETISISSGWEGHAISVIFANNTIFICNRGEGATEHAIMAYECHPERLTEEFIQKIRTRDCKNLQEFETLFNGQDAIGPLIPESCMDMRWQKVGNCSCANTKAIFHVLAYLEIKRTRPDLSPTRVQEEARRIYKLWSAHVRIEATKAYANLPLEKISFEMLIKLIEKTASSRSLSGTQKVKLLTLLKQKTKEKTSFLERSGKKVPETNEIKAAKAAAAENDVATIIRLIQDAVVKNNIVLVKEILKLCPEQKNVLLTIAIDTANKIQNDPMTIRLSELMTNRLMSDMERKARVQSESSFWNT